MTTKLKANGDGLYLLIDPSLLEGLKIDQDTPLEVTSDGEGLYIRPEKKDDTQELFVESARRMMTIHAETFRKLAE